jgi:hypothetical protein
MQYFSYIMVTSFSGGGSRSTRRETPTMGKQLVNFITCGCKSSAPFFVIYCLSCLTRPKLKCFIGVLPDHVTMQKGHIKRMYMYNNVPCKDLIK